MAINNIEYGVLNQSAIIEVIQSHIVRKVYMEIDEMIGLKYSNNNELHNVQNNA